MHPVRLLRLASVAEAITWALLFAGILLRAIGGGQWLVAWAGSAHGVAFTAFIVALVTVAALRRWPVWAILTGLAAAVVPFATLAFEWGLVPRLAHAATQDAAPGRRAQAAASWFERHPFTLTAATTALFVFVLANALAR